jgi:anthranilate synthase component 1
MFYPALEKVRELSKSANVIPVSAEYYADTETPISIYKRFEDSSYSFLLESVEGGEKWARYSFIGRNPFIILESKDNQIKITDKTGKTTYSNGNPVDILKEILGKYKGADLEGIPRFNGGAVGFFGYDLIRFYENLSNTPTDDLQLPDCHFMLADEVLAFDHLKQKIHIIVNMHVKDNIERSYNTAINRIEEIYKEINASRWKLNECFKQVNGNINKPLELKSNMSKEEYCKIVEKAKDYIFNGDIFQVVLSRRISVETKCQPIDIYRALRVINPSPYMYCLRLGEYSIVGSSPEMLVRVEDGEVETCPIAGTRKRGKNPAEDEALEQELLADKKELAEHTMLVDLGRNDIGRIAEIGSVKVLNQMHVEKYSHVMHIVSNVKGKLRKDKTPFDALMSVMPAGTLSGAPKIRAMEIIDELEPTKRGTYGGAIGYISFNGNLDSCITIRTLVLKNGKAYLQAGAGIVADSVPESEYDETQNKAGALLKAIEEARKNGGCI